ncbi:AraC family transcriptional regulator [Mucilaginibacter pineti]|uniref:AraC family transcriptional regulator n=2 Tax=Mucilaginibacter pineti TaxID=1391627 RepID=A0A1G7L901_9SPHI|nr:AraC family transcriptional regulator [Mucilaginibacter pineti]
MPSKTFLGNISVSKAIDGGFVALTQYSDKRIFEEWHCHENASISFLLNGVHEEDLLGKHYKRVPGDIKFIPAGEMHRCNAYAASTKKINLDLKHSLLHEMTLSEDVLLERLLQNRQTKFTLLKLYHEIHDKNGYGQASLQLLLYELFHPVNADLKSYSGKLPLWVLRLKEILNDEWDVRFDLQDLAHKAGVHPVTISRYFPQYFSSTLSSYLRSIRVEKSINLIKTTSLSLTEIAYTCGFADQAHFTRSFKMHTGFVPKDFRKI